MSGQLIVVVCVDVLPLTLKRCGVFSIFKEAAMAAGRMRSTRRLRSWIVEQVCVAVYVCVCMSVRGRQGEGKDK